MSCCGATGCGTGCKCGSGCGGCKMYPDMGNSGETSATQITIVDGVTPKKSIIQVSEMGVGEGKEGCESGNACTCNPCTCNPCNCK